VDPRVGLDESGKYGPRPHLIPRPSSPIPTALSRTTRDPKVFWYLLTEVFKRWHERKADCKTAISLKVVGTVTG